MHSRLCIIAKLALLTAVALQPSAACPGASRPHNEPASIALPEAKHHGDMAVESALALRRSVRRYEQVALPLSHVAQLLWAGQGQSAPLGRRTAPSAGALYPLEISLIAGEVDGLAPGVYRYAGKGHALSLTRAGDMRREIAAAAFKQHWIAAAPACLLISAVSERTARKYGARAQRYVLLEAGHASQNVLLQAVALRLGATVVGAFDDDSLQDLLGLPEGEKPLLLIPVGYGTAPAPPLNKPR